MVTDFALSSPVYPPYTPMFSFGILNCAYKPSDVWENTTPLASDLKKRPTERVRLFFVPMLMMSLNFSRSQSAIKFVVPVDWMYSYWKRPSAARYIVPSLLNGARHQSERISFWSSERVETLAPVNFVVLSIAPPKSAAAAGSTAAASSNAAIAILIEI